MLLSFSPFPVQHPVLSDTTSDPLSGTESWEKLCRLRREKIASEEKIAVLIAELAETEDSVNERERAAQRAIAAVTDLSTRLATFRRYDCRVIFIVLYVFNYISGWGTQYGYTYYLSYISISLSVGRTIVESTT